MNYKICIAGYGMVGGALAKCFKDPTIYDPPQKIGSEIDLETADIIFVCVPTPYSEEKNGFNLSYIKDVVKKIKGSKIIILKSTVLPGTTNKFQESYSQHTFLFNPEFLTEATAQEDMLKPRRQIIGYTNNEGRSIAGEILKLLPDAPYTAVVKAKEAEMIKLMNNTFFATKVVFANQIYDLCQKLNINYATVKAAAGAEPWLGPNHLEIFHKGFRGYSGACLPKDTKALIRLGELLGVPMEFLKKVDDTNNRLIHEK